MPCTKTTYVACTMTTERSVGELFAIRVLRSADCALRSTNGELLQLGAMKYVTNTSTDCRLYGNLAFDGAPVS
jgi:hypothetical protein